MSLQNYVKTVLADLVDHPGELKMTEVTGEKTVIFELRCHQEDIGKLIGKNGKTISAVRTLAGQVAARQGIRVLVEVVE
mgnify:CR=1 FL=1|jgi:predicted RNA-binding protein YlqC (UPF0109 family)